MVKNGSVFAPVSVYALFSGSSIRQTPKKSLKSDNRFSGAVLMAGFIGKELHALDEKGRLMIPARFRRDFVRGNGVVAENKRKGSDGSVDGIYLYIMKAPDGSLELYEPDVWQEMKKTLAGLSDFNPEQRLLKTMIYESLDVVAVDRQGRIPLSREFLDHAGIMKELVIIGADTKMVIWEPERLASVVHDNAGKFAALAGRYF